MSQPNENNQYNNQGGFSSDAPGSEFTGTYNTTTGSVSHVFKDGGFFSETKNKVLVGVAVLLLAVGGYYYFDGDFSQIMSTSSPTEDEFSEDTPIENKGDAIPEDRVESASTSTQVAPPMTAVSKINSKTTLEQEAIPVKENNIESTSAAMSSVPTAPATMPVIVMPKDKVRRIYDESSAPATFTWEGTARKIEFSRLESMDKIDQSFNLSSKNKNKFYYNKLAPGVWFWRLSGPKGKTAVQSFEVMPPLTREIVLSTPTQGGTLAGNGGTVEWSGDTKVAHYRLEFTAPGSSPIEFRTSATSMQVSGLSAGEYNLRVGGFSEVSGEWEYTPSVSVTVQ